MLRFSIRGFRTLAGPLYSANAAQKPGASALGELRKKSGYSLSLCKKALASNDQNVDKAFQWLQEQAQAQGWDKANKLEGRATAQGLIGVQVQGKHATMVELNCETDFVARNKQFLSLLGEVTALNLKAANSLGLTEGEDVVVKHLAKEDVDKLEHQGGKSLSDLVALNIGQIGEKISARKSTLCSSCNQDVHMIGFTHPSGDVNLSGLSYGRYGVLMALHKDPDSGELPDGQSIQIVGRQLCQHVVGMNPTKIGNLHDPSTWPKKKEKEVEKEEPKKQMDNADNPYGDFDETVTDIVDHSVQEMIHQPFLLDSDRLVRDVLLEAGLSIKSFVRYEVGQAEQ